MKPTIETLTEQINEAASAYQVGGLQQLRAKLHGKRARTKKIFSKATIFEDYAYHDGGRTELQFNIGVESHDQERWWWHGVAFSFETSQGLPDPAILLPKVRRFNVWARANADALKEFKLWHWDDGLRPSEDRSPIEIPETLARVGVFVFVGKRVRESEVDVDRILRDFDRLYPLYEFIESSVEPEERAVSHELEQALLVSLEKKHGSRQGFLLNKELRLCLEQYAMEAAKRYFESSGFAWEDHSKNHPYDLWCKRREEVLYVEVKGTQTRGEEIILTAGEVEFARSHKPQMGLFTLHSIQVSENGGEFTLAGGEGRLTLPWDVDEGCLKALSFMYQVPLSGKKKKGSRDHSAEPATEYLSAIPASFGDDGPLGPGQSSTESDGAPTG